MYLNGIFQVQNSTHRSPSYCCLLIGFVMPCRASAVGGVIRSVENKIKMPVKISSHFFLMLHFLSLYCCCWRRHRHIVVVFEVFHSHWGVRWNCVCTWIPECHLCEWLAAPPWGTEKTETVIFNRIMANGRICIDGNECLESAIRWCIKRYILHRMCFAAQKKPYFK